MSVNLQCFKTNKPNKTQHVVPLLLLFLSFNLYYYYYYYFIKSKRCHCPAASRVGPGLGLLRASARLPRPWMGDAVGR